MKLLASPYWKDELNRTQASIFIFPLGAVFGFLLVPGAPDPAVLDFVGGSLAMGFVAVVDTVLRSFVFKTRRALLSSWTGIFAIAAFFIYQ